MNIIEAFRILKAFIVFKKEINDEISNPDSMFNRLELNRNKFGDVIYKQYDFDDSDFMSSDYNSEKMVMNKVSKVIEYFDKDLRWGDNMVLNISQFFDEDGYPTHSYAMMYKFDGASESVNTIIRYGLYFLFGLIVLIGIVLFFAI